MKFEITLSVLTKRQFIPMWTFFFFIYVQTMTATIFSNVNAVDIFVKNKNILVTENWKKSCGARPPISRYSDGLILNGLRADENAERIGSSLFNKPALVLVVGIVPVPLKYVPVKGLSQIVPGARTASKNYYFFLNEVLIHSRYRSTDQTGKVWHQYRHFLQITYLQNTSLHSFTR